MVLGDNIFYGNGLFDLMDNAIKAAEFHVGRSITNLQIFLETNILGTAMLMDACRKYRIERYHQISTDEVYGEG